MGRTPKMGVARPNRNTDSSPTQHPKKYSRMNTPHRAWTYRFVAALAIFTATATGLYHLDRWVDHTAPDTASTIRWITAGYIIIRLASAIATKTQQDDQ